LQSSQFEGYFYRSAMSLGSIGLEATHAMSAACVDEKAAFNTGEGALSIHHLPRVKYDPKHKWMKAHKVPGFLKPLYWITPGKRLKNYLIDFFGYCACPRNMRDL